MTVKQYDIVLNYDTSKADASLASFRAGVIRSFQDLSSKTASIEVFKDLSADAKKSQQAISELGVRAAELRRILGAMASGDAGVKQLAADLKQGAAQMTELERSAARGEKSLAALAVREKELQERADSAAASVGKIRAELAGLSGQDPAFKKISSEVASAERDLVKAQAAVAKNTEQFRLMQAAVQASYAKVAELRSAFNGLESGDAAFKRISAALQLAEKDLAANQAKVIGNRLAFNELRDAVGAAEQRVSGLREKLSGLSAGDPAFKSLSASAKAAERELASAEKALSAVREKSRSLSEVIEQTRAKMDSLRQTQLTLVDALKKSEQGVVGYKLLQDNLRAVEVELKKTERQFATQTAQLERLDGELRAAGVDTKNLAAEQAALAKALEASQRAIAAQAARQTLGVVSTDEARAQIAKLREAYDVLRASGTATTNELAVAKANLNAKIREVEESLRGAGSAATKFNQQAIAVAATTSAIGVGLKSAASAAIAFEQGLARIGSISDFSRSQLESLKRKVLEITQAIGIEAPTALRALYEIISAGIPEQNALTVFEKASKAAIAGFTDIDTAARVGISVLNSYGLQVSQLDSVYDKLFVTVRDGIVTFPQLAQDLGAVLPAARQAGVSLDQLSAAMVTLTRSGLSVPEAATGIENAIKSLSAPAPEAAAALREAGISVGDFGKTLDEVAKKNLSLSFLREIIPDARAIRAVAAITQNYNTYSDAIKSAGDSAGAAKKAFDALKDTPEQQIKKLMASVEALKVAIGDGLLKGVITGVNALRDLAKEAAELDKQALALAATLGGGALTAAVAALAARFGGLSAVAGAAAAALAGLGGFQLGQMLADWSPKVKVFGDLLGGFLAAGVTDVSARFSLLKATIEGNTQAQEQARATIAANAETWREFNGVTASSRLAIADLTKKQRELNDQLDKAKNTAINSLGKYG